MSIGLERDLEGGALLGYVGNLGVHERVRCIDAPLVACGNIARAVAQDERCDGRRHLDGELLPRSISVLVHAA